VVGKIEKTNYGARGKGGQENAVRDPKLIGPGSTKERQRKRVT